MRPDDAYPCLLGLATRTVIEPLVRAPYLTVASWMRDFFAWPDERRRAWQMARLSEVADHARRHVPRYRQDLGARAAGTRQLELREFPVIDKRLMRADMGLFRSDDWARMPHIRKRTGGSTGVPFDYLLDKRAWAHSYGAAIHFYERTGFRYGERVLLLGSPTSLGLDDRSWKSALRHRLERHDVSLAGFDIDPETSADRAVRAGAVGAALWYGFAGTIAAMAEATLERGLEVRPPRSIVTTAEPLLPAWRTSIERAFGRSPFDQYGCNDGGIMSQTCARGRFHVAENVSIVEVLDDTGAPAPAGAEGNVTVTNLHARVMPFLRYQTGDRAVLGSGACPCGTPGQTLERMAGRTGDQLLLPGGNRQSPLGFGPLFAAAPGVQRWQIVQSDPATVKVRLAVDATYDSTQQRHIAERIQQRLGPTVRVSLTVTEPFERTPGGKHKIVVRDFEDEAAAS